MGWSAARKLRRAVDGLRRVLAIEVLNACRAIGLRAPTGPAPATGAVLDLVLGDIAPAGPDRFLTPEMDKVVDLLATGRLVAAARAGGADLE